MMNQDFKLTGTKMTGVLSSDFIYDTNQRGASYCDDKGTCTDDIIYVSGTLPQGTQVTGNVSTATGADANGALIRDYFLTVELPNALDGKIAIPFKDLKFEEKSVDDEFNDLLLLMAVLCVGVILLSDD